MERRTLARWLVFAALVCFGFVLAGGIASAQEGTVVQGQNGSADSDAASDEAVASNELSFGAGPQAGGEDAPAQAAQNGDNAGSFSQHARARSGDAAAGSQVHGVVGGSATIQAQSSSDGAVAASGPATASNVAEYILGPRAASDGETAQASQVGDNRLDASQSVIAESGDAVAGSQVTGVVGDGHHTVQNQLNAEDAEAETGEVEVENTLEDVTVGPLAQSEDAEAQASQIGDNDLVLTQATEGRSGDAVAGAQVAGAVGSGDSTSQGQTTSADAEATTGDVFAANAVEAVNVGPSATTEDESAQASQNGDNSAEIDQQLTAGSGDAIAGGQVAGLVSEEAGHIKVQNQQSSDGDTAETGEVDTEGNLVDGLQVGPSAEAVDEPAASTQSGDNHLSIAQSGTLASGDAVAGAQVTGAVASGDVTVQNQNDSADSEATSGDVAGGELVNSVEDLFVGPTAVSEDANATAAQVGDNSLSFDQTAELSSGDAVAGAQITGVVNDPATITVQAQNSSDAAEAESGEIAPGVVNEVSDAAAGPVAASEDEAASASQIGDNDGAFSQHATLASGDAVAGSQVSGVVSDHGDVTASLQSSSADDTASSGAIEPDETNVITAAGFGPAANAEDATALASQNGDNANSVDQSAELRSGDAVAGAQVTGIVAQGGDATVQNQNDSDASESLSGDVSPDTVNSVDTFGSGPFATSVDEAALASQNGDNDLSVSQSAVAHSGDAVAGAQVTGIVADPADVSVQNQNFSTDSEATSGDAAVDAELNTIEEAFAGPFALTEDETASATQDGSNDLSLGQDAHASSGDAVAGAQVTGVVVGSGKVTVQNQNDADTPVSETGTAADGATVNAIADVSVGPNAESVDETASAAQVGDGRASVDQSAVVESGDAVAGSQVTGVAGNGGDVTVQNQNSSADAEAVTGDATAENLAEEITVGPAALGDGEPASASQIGDDSMDLTQTLVASSGDAVAGAQVAGAVSDDSLVQLQNFDDASVAESAEAEAVNEATGNAGPFASAEDGNANVSQLGDTDIEADQAGDAITGDVVSGGQVNGIAGFGASALSTRSNLAATAAEASFRVSSAAAA